MRLLAALIGLVYAASVAFLAFLLAAGGHGWVSPMVISAVGLVLLPIGAIAWVRGSRPVMTAVVALAAVADLVLVVATTEEGGEYVRSANSSTPGLVLGWLVLWLGWQLFLLYAALGGRFRAPPGDRPARRRRATR